MRALLVVFYALLWLMCFVEPVGSSTLEQGNFNDSAYSEPGRVTDMRGHYPGDFTSTWRTVYR
jgi:hypothetical protein